MARAGLTREAIAAAALALIDADGVAGFSMRGLGRHLGVDPMATYRYFRNQEDLFDAVAERLFEQTDPGSLPWDGGWRELAGTYCHRLRAVLLAHPRAVPVFTGRPVRSTASIDTGIRMIERLTADGFAPADALRMLRALRELTIGHALTLAAVTLGAGSRSRKPSPGDPEYNALAAADDATELGDHFDGALAAMLDGFDALRR